MLIREFLAERGIDAAEMAALLSERGVTFERGRFAGNPITASAVSKRSGSEIPRRWAEALGLTDSDPLPPLGSDAQGSPGEGADGQSERRETPPRRPAEARIEIVQPGAKKRIAGAYKFAGAALAAGAGSAGVAEVWADQADPIAQLWIDAAADNPWAARFVNMMNAGGAGGDLAAAHLYLIGASFYVLGAGIPGGDAIFAKYARHRPPERPKPAAGAAEPERNGKPEGDAVAAPGAVVDGLG